MSSETALITDTTLEQWDEAIQEYREQRDAKDRDGTLTIHLSGAWRKLRGDLKDHPLFDEWQEAIAAYREHKDKEEGR